MRAQWQRSTGWRPFSAVALVCVAVIGLAAGPSQVGFPDSTGTIATYDTAGSFNQTNPFFQSLGSNGRSCATCHLASNGLSFSSGSARALFASSRGTNPLFAAVDGANCPTAPSGDAASRSLLLNNGLIRVGLTMPASANFTIETLDDPYGCADVIDPVSGQRTLSVYRRPLPTSNLRFLSAVMWDGRETVSPLNNSNTFQANLVTDLRHQAIDATLGHAQAAAAPSGEQVSAIVNFELALFSAQNTDATAGSLQALGASGGPVTLSSQPFYPGINDPLGGNPTGAAFNPQAFTIFSAWTDLSAPKQNAFAAARQKTAAGEAIFNTFPITIRNVAGLNDALHADSIGGTCTTCHDTPNVGNHSLPLPLDIGVSHAMQYESDAAIRAALAQLSLARLPVFRLTCTSDSANVVYTTDPGKALISGQCSDFVRVKGPILRGLAARAPYFHNGSAASLREVVNFYDQRFEMHLTDEQKGQLVAFLQSL